MIEAIPPSLIFFIAAFFIPLFKGKVRSVFMLLIPVIAYIDFFYIKEGNHWQYSFMGFDLILMRADRLSLLFTNIYIIITFIAVIYTLHVKNNLEHLAGFLYAGSAIGVVLAGDLVSFFIFWEMLTIGAVFLILARKTEKSMAAAIRYLLVHIVGGLILLAGIILYIAQHGGAAQFSEIGLKSTAGYLIFTGIGINCAWPLLHAWLTDAYPEATIGGVVFMATFTTKTAVYALARTFPGEPLLLWIGMAMATFPIFYAVIENDLRRVLAYSLINQVGFMVVGIGVGTQLSLNGTSAHAFCHILYKALLFMSMGAVLHQTGKIKATELGGLYKSMPFTCICCIIGAASISAFPFFSGFVSKSMVMTATAIGGHTLMWFALLFASAGVFHHAGIKIPFFAFFSHDSGIRVKEAPKNMLIAMGIAAFLCIFIGTFPHATLYKILPYPVNYEPYTVAHVVEQWQVLFFSALAFTLLLLSGLYPAEMKSINLDADWFYRKGTKVFYSLIDFVLNGINRICHFLFVNELTTGVANFFAHAPTRIMIGTLRGYALVTAMDRVQLREIEEKIEEKMSRSTFPLGTTALFAVCFFAILFVMGL